MKGPVRLLEVKCAGSLGTAIELLNGNPFDVLLLDLNLPDSTGADTLTQITRRYPHLPVVVVTGQHDEDMGLTAVAEGAEEYLTKANCSVQSLLKSVWYAIERKEAQRTRDRLLEELEVSNKELRLIQEKLWKENLFHNAIIRNAAEGLCVCHELPDYPFASFTVWNDRMTEITGFTMDEVNRLGWHQTFLPSTETQARAAERMTQIRQGNDLYAEEWTITRRDGQERTLLISTSTLLSNDGQTDVLAMILDITEHQLAEESRAQLLRQLAETNQRLDDLTYVVSHDLKAPLRAMRALSDGLLDTLELNEQAKENLQLLANHADHMENLIDGILRDSRLDRTEDNTGPVDPSQAVPETIDSVGAPDKHTAI